MLRRYADRGIFTEFEEQPGRGGTWSAQFRWMLPRPMKLVADPARGRLSCPDLLPGIKARSPLHLAIETFLLEREDATLPEHRRVDPARARVRCTQRAGRISVALEPQDSAEWAYAAGKLVNLVHELQLFLNVYWPDYAQQALGAPLE
ncbi:MAG TPA: hypothetical protein VE650_06365 [Acetobacteraceae bacterium]|nr:hypothetical protein [Acetobacteraceae bacterium]